MKSAAVVFLLRFVVVVLEPPPAAAQAPAGREQAVAGEPRPAHAPSTGRLEVPATYIAALGGVLAVGAAVALFRLARDRGAR